MLLESDLHPDEGAVQANPIPNMSYLAAAAWENYGLASTPRLLHTTGVEPTHNIVEFIDSNDDDVEYLSSEVVHEVEAVP